MNIFIDPFEHLFWYNIAINTKCVNHLTQVMSKDVIIKLRVYSIDLLAKNRSFI